MKEKRKKRANQRAKDEKKDTVRGDTATGREEKSTEKKPRPSKGKTRNPTSAIFAAGDERTHPSLIVSLLYSVSRAGGEWWLGNALALTSA